MRVAISIVLRLEKPTSNEQEQKGVIQLKYISKLLEVSLLILLFCTYFKQVA